MKFLKSPKRNIVLAASAGALIIVIIAISLLRPGCGRGSGRVDSTRPPPIARFYKLSPAHPDNSNPLKEEFFHEPLKDIKGADITLANFRGTAIVILMFPIFRTGDGQRSLVMLEKLQKERGGQFQAVVLPKEDPDVIRPVIVKDPPSMWFLFRENGRPNWTLIDRYSSLFWDNGIVKQDFPFDPPENHRASPFFWVVDRDGNIREKLVDYSAKKGVEKAELDIVLNALLGAAPMPESGTTSNGKGDQK